MADPELIALMTKGIDAKAAIEEWVRKNPGMQLDLEGASLDYIELSGADLHGANFASARLNAYDPMGIVLSGVNLSGANFSGADLFGVDFSHSILSRANFSKARFGGYVLLQEALLIGANLSGADLSGAEFSNTSINMCELSGCIGLDLAKHYSPSSIGVDTLIASWRGAGNQWTPQLRTFLRGAGVPQVLLDTLPSMFQENPHQFYSAFISYSSKDEDFVTSLHGDLQAHGVRVWFAPEDLKIGDPLKDTIDAAVRMYDKLMIVLSEYSINSAWVRHEFKNALEKEEQRGQTVLFPIRLDDSVFDTTEQWAYDIRQRHIGDFRNWKSHDDYQKSFERLLRDLDAETLAAK